MLEKIPLCEMPDITPTEGTSEECHPFLGPNWMDDLNVCIASSTNAGIERKAGVALSILLDKCKDLFMVPNLGSGKTEVMWSICLSVYLSACPSVCLSICLSVYLPICLSIDLSIYLSIQNKAILRGFLNKRWKERKTDR